MTRARVKALHDKVNSLLITLDLGIPLDGLLPHADTLCVIRYEVRQDPGEDDTSWSRGGEEQLDVKMDVELDPTSSEARKGREGASRPRTRSDRIPDRAPRSKPDARLAATGHGTEPPGPLSGRPPVQDPVWTGRAGPRAGLTGLLTGIVDLS
jgi:hypothetical protein